MASIQVKGPNPSDSDNYYKYLIWYEDGERMQQYLGPADGPDDKKVTKKEVPEEHRDKLDFEEDSKDNELGEPYDTDEYYFRNDEGEAYKIEQEIYREKRLGDVDTFTVVTKAYDEEGNVKYSNQSEKNAYDIDELEYWIGVDLKEEAMDELGLTPQDSHRATFGDVYGDKVDKDEFDKKIRQDSKDNQNYNDKEKMVIGDEEVKVRKEWTHEVRDTLAGIDNVERKIAEETSPGQKGDMMSQSTKTEPPAEVKEDMRWFKNEVRKAVETSDDWEELQDELDEVGQELEDYADKYDINRI